MSAVEGADLLAAVPVGVRTGGRGRTITAAEIRLLAAVSDLNEPARPVRELLADDSAVELPPALVLPVMVSLAAANPLFRRLELDHGFVVAAALRHACTIFAPVTGGMTLYADSTVTAVRASSSRPGHVVVTVRDDGRDASGMIVIVIERVLLLRHDAPASDPAGTEG